MSCILPTPRINIQQLSGNDFDYLDSLFELMTLQFKVERNQHIDHLKAFILIKRIEQATIDLKSYPEFEKARTIVTARISF